MNNQPLVSIITPSYNQGKFIRATIESVISQKYLNIEYIIVDGGSSDNSLEIIKEYGDRIKWISEKDNGQSDAINKGFRMAKGEIVAWLNSDDTYEPDAIETAVDFFNKNKNAALVYGDGNIIDENGNIVKKFDATQEFDLWTLIHVWDYIMQPTTFFRRKAIEDVGYLDEKLNWCMDWDLWIKLAISHEVGYISKIIANSREYAETKTSTGGIKRLNEINNLMRNYGCLKYPPGYFLYGASTFVSLTEKNKVINFIFKGFMHIVHKRVFNRLPVIYRDRWAGKKICYSIPSFIDEISICGQAMFKENLPLNIKVISNNNKIYQKEIKELGQFNITFKIPKNDKLINTIIIKSNKSVIPSRNNRESSDTRRLSYTILGIKSEQKISNMQDKKTQSGLED